MASYVCPNCGIDFGYPQGLSIHKELGCEWGDQDDE
jgi:DNA-directed RNA polymerase subunit RPC12/RpoP